MLCPLKKRRKRKKRKIKKGSGARLYERDYFQERRRNCNPILHVNNITKTYLYNFDPFKPHFYIKEWGLQGIHYFSYFCSKRILWVLVRTASMSTHNLCFEQKYEKYQIFFSENFHFLVVKFSVYLNRHVFIMDSLATSLKF